MLVYGQGNAVMLGLGRWWGTRAGGQKPRSVPWPGQVRLQEGAGACPFVQQTILCAVSVLSVRGAMYSTASPQPDPSVCKYHLLCDSRSNNRENPNNLNVTFSASVNALVCCASETDPADRVTLLTRFH